MAPLEALSNREKEVVEQLLEGKSNKQIAAALHISVRTVEFHLKNVFDKLHVSSRTELILKLGQSTVVEQGQVAENRDASTSWATSWRDQVSRFGKELRMKITVDNDTYREDGPLAFHEAIIVCLTKYAEFNGRASRSEFWWFFLFVVLVSGALGYLSEALSSVFLIAVLLPLLAVGARRLQDTGRTAWWLLYLLVPVGGLVLLAYYWALPPADELIEKMPPASELTEKMPPV